MGLDIRLPIGAMFAILGLLITLYGLLTHNDAQVYSRSLNLDINLWWGIAMFVFGALMLLLTRRGAKVSGVHPAQTSPAGRATEAREHKSGLEK
jgi:hypothetical protein